MWNKRNTEKTFRTRGGRCASSLLCLLLVMALAAGCGKESGGSTGEVSADLAQAPAESPAEQKSVPAGKVPDAAPGEEQTVTVKTAADGTVKKVTVSSGEDEPEEEAGTGTLPFAVRISYFLDGKEMEPETLAGANGHLRMRFDYENLSCARVEGKETIVPFLFLSAVFLSEDHFSNVKVENGDTASFRDNIVAYGYAMPGWKDALALAAFEDKANELTEGLADLEIHVDPDEKDAGKKKEEPEKKDDEELKIKLPEYVEIEADVTDFQLDFAATIVTNGLLADMEEDTKDGLADLSEAASAFGEAGDALSDGTGELKDGAEEYRGYLKTYIDGSTELANSVNSILQSVTPYIQAASSADLTSVLDGIDTEKVLTNIQAVQQNGRTVLAGVDQLAGILEQAAPALAESGVDLSGVDLDAIRAAAEELTAQAGEAEQVLAGMDKETLERMLWDAYGQLWSLQDGLRQLSESASSLSEGTAQLAEAGPQLLEGYDALTEGIEALRDGTEEFNKEGLQVIAGLFGDEFGAVREKLWALHLADAQYRAHGIYDGEEGNVLYILESEEIG